MSQVRIAHCITRWVEGGAVRVVAEVIRGLPEYGHWIAAGPEDRADDFAAPAPVETIGAMRRSVRPVRDVQAVAQLVRFLRRIRPRLLHAHTYKAMAVAAAAARIAGVPVVVTPHGHVFDAAARIPGVPESRAGRGVLYWIARAAQYAADRVVAVSEADRRSMLALGLAPRKRTVVITNGLNVESFPARSPDARRAARRRFGAGEADEVVAAAGRLAGEKGYDVLLHATARLSAGRPRLRVFVAGEGPDRAELEALAGHLGVASRVTFLGHLRDLRDLLAAADLFAHPSRFESFGLAVLEAMAAGLPVAASRVGGLCDLIDDPAYGTLVAPGDAGALADAMGEFLENPAAAAAVGLRARRRVASRYSTEAMVQGHRALYHELLAAR